ncbi:hypothetical protein BMS3Abin10_00189 [bacterium BMS3Abin10]|nr:hypothetical protein BMS3Abin10_00189 [bacterium BMS3Abin10]GBE39821.1 hypothetical protein BMS3Bbin08_02453 [bacterium BMS3Bbin08]
MPQITLDLPFEKIVDTVKRLSEEDRERLFFAVNEDYARALGKMRDEARKEHQAGDSTPLKNLDKE